MAKANATTTTNTKAFYRLVALVGWDRESFDEKFASQFVVQIDKEATSVKCLPLKANKATNEFQREFVRAARAAGFRSDYANNTGVWTNYKKAEPKV